MYGVPYTQTREMKDNILIAKQLTHFIVCAYVKHL